MEPSQPNFNLELYDSYDDNSLFITQTPRENADEENVNNQSVEELDIENLLESSVDSAIESVTCFDGKGGVVSDLELYTS